jgi:Bacterial Ig-like domain (group 3)
VTFTAYVTPVYGMTSPTGTVTFYDGSSALDTETLDSGEASFTTSALALGSHPITAVYNGDGNFQSSASVVLTEAVNQATTSTSLQSSATPSNYGQAVTFTVNVTASYQYTPTGTVSFYDGSALLDTETLSDGEASFTTSALAAGNHAITAVYSGDSVVVGSTSAILTQEVNQALTTVLLTSSLNPASSGQDVTFTAVVSLPNGCSGTPTGTMSFYDGTTLLATVTLDNTGTATFTTSTLAMGNNSITAVYTGDGNFIGSTSNVLDEQVTC